MNLYMTITLECIEPNIVFVTVFPSKYTGESFQQQDARNLIKQRLISEEAELVVENAVYQALGSEPAPS